jgi:hypothetical protein
MFLVPALLIALQLLNPAPFVREATRWFIGCDGAETADSNLDDSDFDDSNLDDSGRWTLGVPAPPSQ